MSPSNDPILSGRTHDVRVFSDREALGEAAAEFVAACIEEAVEENGQAALLLSGGSTPLPCYRLLGSTYRDRLPWDQVHLFWGDDRFVPREDPDSNYGTAEEAFIQHVPIPEENVHPVPTELNAPHVAADIYEETLREFFADDEDDRAYTFDLALLGMGADGHTASLFAKDRPQELLSGRDAEPPRWVVAVEAPERHAVSQRITLTLPALNRARRACFLVAGEDKRDPLRRALSGDRSLPASYVQPAEELVWFVDEAAKG